LIFYKFSRQSQISNFEAPGFPLKPSPTAEGHKWYGWTEDLRWPLRMLKTSAQLEWSRIGAGGRFLASVQNELFENVSAHRAGIFEDRHGYLGRSLL